nr:FapA family protein [Sporosarcina sp. ACRSL]
MLPLIEVIISSDRMKAEVLINMTVTEFETQKDGVLQQVRKTIEDHDIVFGTIDLTEEDLLPGVPITAAIGREPEKGMDAQITYIEKPDRKPVIREDGVADYYEMNFVKHVEEGDWLGEKIPPTDGKPGKDIFGKEIAALPGSDAKLQFDRKSVVEIEEQGKIVLRALFGGALEYIEDNVSVGKHLIINGDIGPETGSITFDGSVSVYGTVMAGYSVNATGDISIEGNEGITNAKEICSSEGDLYIKGGVFGGNVSLIEASGDIFIKHANNCKLFAKNINVGLYILGSEVVGENVYVDKNRGKIIGGRIEALFKIECGFAGNAHERTTHLLAKGIDKDLIYKEIQQMALELKELQKTVGHLESQLSVIDGGRSNQLLGEKADAYMKLNTALQASRDKMFELDREIQAGLYKIKTAIPPRIEVAKEAYPGVIIEIGAKSSLLNKPTKGVFEVVDNVLNV